MYGSKVIIYMNYTKRLGKPHMDIVREMRGGPHMERITVKRT